MNDRTFKVLERAGVQETPLASLDYEQQLFALTAQHLAFEAEEGGAQQQVTLRDVTRIHSDQTGTLRIETGSRTAITASLLGYDPNRVQHFFQLVRDTTARAKQLPAAPAAAPGPVFFGKASATPPVNAPLSSLTKDSTAELPTSELTPQASGLDTAPLPAVETAEPNAIHIGAELPKEGAPLPTSVPVDNISTIRVRANPKATGLQANGSVKQELNTSVLDDAPSNAQPQVQPIVVPEAANIVATGLAQSDELSPGTTQKATAPLLLGQTELLKRARGIGGLSATVRVLALVLVLGSLGMGYVMWRQQAQHVPALWTVTIGIVTAVALLVLAEVLRYLATLGQLVAEQGKGQ